MNNRVLKTIAGIFSAFLAAALISQLLILVGPFVGGVIVMVLNLSPNPQLAKTMESAGNIFVLIVSIYIGIKIYRKIIGKQKDVEST